MNNSFGKNIMLSNGVAMPCMAIGTNWMAYNELRRILVAGFEAGFRAIDTARDYGNEPVVGKALRDALKDVGLRREDVFVTTKIGNGQQRLGNIKEQMEISLKNLRTDYVDLWLMHWPYPGFYESTWRKMIDVYKAGKARAIGVANYDVRHFKQLLADKPEVIPMVNQMEYHPLRTAKELTAYMRRLGMKIQAYAPLCRLVPPLKESQLLNSLAGKYNKSLGQIILRWHIQQGDVMPVFKSYKPQRFKENIDIFDFELTGEEMAGIYSLDQDYKYHIESVNCPGY